MQCCDAYINNQHKLIYSNNKLRRTWQSTIDIIELQFNQKFLTYIQIQMRRTCKETTAKGNKTWKKDICMTYFIFFLTFTNIQMTWLRWLLQWKAIEKMDFKGWYREYAYLIYKIDYPFIFWFLFYHYK